MTLQEIKVDAITVEIVQNALNGFIGEMRGNIIRTAFGPTIWETHDFSCGLLAPDGELVALSEDNPVHIVPTMYSVPELMQHFAGAINQGDIFLFNDPYRLGTHMNDVAHLYPFFVATRLTFWIVVRVHYPDVGGMAAGSITPDAREVYQEGIRIPPIKVYECGRLNKAVTDLFFANIRVADERRADFMAVVGALRTGDRRLQEIVDKFGLETILQAHRVLCDRAQRRIEAAIASLPEGTFCYELNLDSDGVGPGWVPLRVELNVSHRPTPLLTADFSNSAPSVIGPMNGAPATAACASVTAIKAFLDPHSQINGGAFRPIRIITKPGTIFAAQLPMAMCGSLDLGYRAIELVMGALGGIRPEGAVGDFSSPTHQYMTFWDEEKQHHVVSYEVLIGGTGAVATHDGNDAEAGFERGDFPRVTSVEIWEHKFPFLAVENALLPDSCGAGKFRGGLGMRRSWRVLADRGAVSDLSEPSLIPNYGVLGGHGGTPSTCRVIRGEELLWPGGLTGTGKATRFPLRKGDVVQFEKWGGGGYGDALERDPALVMEDLREGYISGKSAHDLYGVVFRDAALDPTATEELRAELRAARVYLTVAYIEADAMDGSDRLWIIAPTVADRLHVEARHVLECLVPRRAPLRGRVQIASEIAAGELRVGPIARKILGVREGDKVWIRPIKGVLEK